MIIALLKPDLFLFVLEAELGNEVAGEAVRPEEVVLLQFAHVKGQVEVVLCQARLFRRCSIQVQGADTGAVTETLPSGWLSTMDKRTWKSLTISPGLRLMT